MEMPSRKLNLTISLAVLIDKASDPRFEYFGNISMYS
jgi:hypothetical protein